MSDLAQLQHEKSVLERKHASIVGVIHELRQRARQKSIEASATRQPLPEAEIAHWQNGIKRHQAELMEVQAKIAEVNKELRKAKADQPIKTLSRLPRDAVQPGDSAHRRPAAKVPDNVDVFLSCFFQITRDSLDPRQFAALEKDARQLAADHERMHGGRP